MATKEYADKVGDSPLFKKNGNYQATYTINMAYKKLVNLRAPSEPYDAITKDYVDYVKSTYRNIIAVHASYYGELHKGEFQFSFGGNGIDTNGTTVFLMPQSGRIKKYYSINRR